MAVHNNEKKRGGVLGAIGLTNPGERRAQGGLYTSKRNQEPKTSDNNQNWQVLGNPSQMATQNNQ